MKMYYVVNARLPNKKAYGIQIAKMCEAFIEAGVDFTLIIPRTRAARSSSTRDFYHLRVDIPTVTLPAPDWYDKGRIGYAISSLIFAKFLFYHFLYRRLRGERGYPASRIREALRRHGTLVRDYVPLENQYHHFFVLEKRTV